MQKGQVGAMWKPVLSTWHLNWTNIPKLLREQKREKHQVRPLRTFIEVLQAITIEKVEILKVILLNELSQRQVFLNAQFYAEGIRAEQSATVI